MYLVNPGGYVAPVSKLMIEKLADCHFQTEMTSFNLEANLETQNARGSFLRDAEWHLPSLLSDLKTNRRL